MKQKLSEEHYQALKLLVYDQLDLESNISEDEVEQDFIENWSSSKHLSLIMEIESKFNISFKIEDVLRMNTFESIVQRIEEQPYMST